MGREGWRLKQSFCPKWMDFSSCWAVLLVQVTEISYNTFTAKMKEWPQFTLLVLNSLHKPLDQLCEQREIEITVFLVFLHSQILPKSIFPPTATMRPDFLPRPKDHFHPTTASHTSWSSLMGTAWGSQASGSPRSTPGYGKGKRSCSPQHKGESASILNSAVPETEAARGSSPWTALM